MVDGTPQREKIIDAGLAVLVRRASAATTVDEIAVESGVTPEQVSRHFDSAEEIVLTVIDTVQGAVVTALAEVDPRLQPLPALLAATTRVLDDITAGTGVITGERLQALADILIASDDLQARASGRRKQLLNTALAGRLGVGANDGNVRRAVTVWSAVMAGAHNPHPDHRVRIDPSRDGRVPDLMRHRLTDTFIHITGTRPT